MASLETVPKLGITEPLVSTPLDLEKKYKQYRIIAILFFLLSIISIILLMCSIFYGFGCDEKHSSTMKKKSSTMAFLHVSDMHLDVYYNQSTSKASFCRSVPNTLNVTPVAAPFEAPYGRVYCDSPMALVQSSLNFMKSLSSKGNHIKFFLLSGDQVAHDLEKGFINGTVADRVFNTLTKSANTIKDVFSDIPVIPSIGNNDLTGDYLLPKNKSYYERLLSIWKPLIICSKCPIKVTTEEELSKSFLIGGYYKAEIKDENLVLLQLNTNYWSQRCINLNPGTHTTSIADAQLSWLTQQLKDAKTSGKVAIISGHILAGIDGYSGGSHASFWAKNYTTKYIELVTKTYRDVVIGQLFGHIHKDEIRLHRLSEKAPKDEVSFLLTAPGITPVYRNNPGFRVVSFDKDKRLLSNYEQYYMDIVLSTQNKKPIWMFDYSFGDRYLENVPLEKRAITGKAVADVIASFINQTNMNRHWQTFIQHRQVNYQPDAYNRYKLYCTVNNVMKEDFDKCAKMYPVTGG